MCASHSCPPLRREPYRADTLDAQLDDNARSWLADPRKGVSLDAAVGTLSVSPIFRWSEEDFAGSGGVLSFLRKHADLKTMSWLERHGAKARLQYLDYDWRINNACAPGAAAYGALIACPEQRPAK